jgi:putative oxidoreductase
MTISNSVLLRIPVVITLLAHSIPSIVTGGVNDFGTQYLDQIGFAPLGLPLAWAIKLSHVAAAICLVLNKYVWPVCIITIVILVMGIVLIHFEAGWFVVGFGRNGMEFNVLLIFVLLAIMFPNGISGIKTRS